MIKKGETRHEHEANEHHAHHLEHHPHDAEHHPHHVEHHIHHKESQMERVLLENFVSLQRVLTNLSVKLDNLSTQISKLLDIFEISAKALAEKDFQIGGESKDVSEKVDKLLDQNKILARGISMMHERMPREYYPNVPQPMMQQQPQQKPIQVQQTGFTQSLHTTSQPQQKAPEPIGRMGQRMSFSQEIQEEENMPQKFESPM